MELSGEKGRSFFFGKDFHLCGEIRIFASRFANVNIANSKCRTILSAMVLKMFLWKAKLAALEY